jgi:hypothetical protein
MKRGDQVWWRQWQGTVVGYEPTNPDAVHVDLHQHVFTDDLGKTHQERNRYFDVSELSVTAPPGVVEVVGDAIPAIPFHPLRGHLLNERPAPKESV